MRLATLALTLYVSVLCAQERPVFTAADVRNAADYSGGGVAPSEVVVLYPSHAGPVKLAPWVPDGSYRTDPLGDTRVLFDGIAAPMVYSMSGQVCAIVPHQIAGHDSTQIVVEYQGVPSDPVAVPVLRSAPAMFTLDASGKGQAAMLNESGCCNSVRNPAPRGTAAAFYATGDGQMRIKGAALPVATLPVKVTVGGVPATVDWAGNVGVLQVNFRVPENAPVGDAVPLVLTVGDASSSSAVTMAVRSSKQQILVVHSELIVRRRLKEILSGAGYDVVTVAGSDSAIASSQAQSFDMVIADLALPRTVEMMQALRRQHPQVRVVAISPQATSQALKAADILQAQAVLTRPIAAPAVLERVGTLLQRKRAVY